MRDVECGYGDFNGVPGHQHLINNGPVVAVHIGYDYTFDPRVKGAVPALGSHPYPALIDTGATLSSIDSVLAADLGLRVLDNRPALGIGGVQYFDRYLAQVFVPSLGTTIWGAFQGMHLSAGGPYKAILGRAFLAHFTMVYEGWTGSVKLTARSAMLPWETP